MFKKGKRPFTDDILPTVAEKFSHNFAAFLKRCFEAVDISFDQAVLLSMVGRLQVIQYPDVEVIELDGRPLFGIKEVSDFHYDLNKVSYEHGWKAVDMRHGKED